MARADLLRVWASLLAAVFVAGLLAAAAFSTGAEAQETGCRGQVVLDAGHGGTDSGAVNARYGLKEKEQTLDVARRLEALLEADGYTVCMTRTTDETLSNNDRYTYANTTGAKVLVSVHMNGSSDPGVDYTTTLFGKWQKDKAFAQTIFKSLSTLPAASGTGTIATRTPYSFASGVLLKSNMPATIAETVFITNDKEAEWLKNGRTMPDGTVVSRQQQIAEALRTGIENHLSTLP
jgi:N-acetylmuramoyl-L-alanine amidase